MSTANRAPGSPEDSPEIAALKEQKARIDLENQIAKARHDRDDDDVGAADRRLRGRSGQITGSTYAKGDTTLDPGAGAAEATLIAAHALDVAADRIAAAISRVALDDGVQRRWVLFAGTQRPGLGNWQLFDVRRALIEAAFDNAKAVLAEAISAIPKPVADPKRTIIAPGLAAATGAFGPLVSGVGIGLDLAAKVGSYLASDYKVSPVAVSGLDDDLLALAIAGRLANACYPARGSAAGSEPLKRFLEPLQNEHHAAPSIAQQARDNAAALGERAKTEVAQAKPLRAAADLFAKAADLFAAAAKAYDDLLAALAADSAGAPWISRVIDEHAVAEALQKGGNPIFVHLNHVGGGAYTEKNLFTAFGSIPLHVMGGVIASYAAIHGKTGTVLAAGQVPVHGGYHRIDEVAGVFGKRWGHRD